MADSSRANALTDSVSASGCACFALADRENLHTHEHADLAKLRGDRGFSNMTRTMWTGGAIALWDFAINMPAVLKRHAAIDAYYKQHGQFKKAPDG